MFLSLPSKTPEGGRPASVSAVSDGMWSYFSDSDKTPSAKSEKGRRRQATSNMWEYCSDSEGESPPQAAKAALTGTAVAIHNALPPGGVSVMLHDGESDEEDPMAMASSIYQRFEQDWQSAACVRHRSSAKSTVRHRSSSGRSGVQRHLKFPRHARTCSEPVCKKISTVDPCARVRGKSANAVVSRKQGQAAAWGAKGQASPQRSQSKAKDTGTHALDAVAKGGLVPHLQKIVDALPQQMQQQVLQQLARTEKEITHLRSVVHAYEDMRTSGSEVHA